MPWTTAPDPYRESPDERAVVARIAATLDPVLVPLGFAPAQGGLRDGRGQVVWCRGIEASSDDGCADLVLEIESSRGWTIAVARYSELDPPIDRGPHDELEDQLRHLAESLPGHLGG